MCKKTADRIIKRLEDAGERYWANDNISDYIYPGDLEDLQLELESAFDKVMRSLIIDVKTDPNSNETAKRLAKMYLNEIMVGRYTPIPECTGFPNEDSDGYDGLLTIRAEIKSVCSHHHQPVTGIAYIGIIPKKSVLGLSKYIRIAQWCARRGTLQESLTGHIAKEIKYITGVEDIAVYVEAEHGCCVNRGVSAHSSLTQTSVVYGSFKYDEKVREEFYNNIKLQKVTNG